MNPRDRWNAYSDRGGPLDYWEWCAFRDELAHLDAQALVSMLRRAEILAALQGQPEALPVS